uniref:Uncharacterized protein n=1 Tax=Rhizophora mucronata TaxID=61149 RepID=A0A2P2NRE6_RHIMU
MPFKSTSTF